METNPIAPDGSRRPTRASGFARAALALPLVMLLICLLVSHSYNRAILDLPSGSTVIVNIKCKLGLTVSPLDEYHLFVEEAVRRAFDPSPLGDWQKTMHQYDDKIHSEADAVKYANLVLKPLNDRFTAVLNKEESKAVHDSMRAEIVGIGIYLENSRPGATVIDLHTGKVTAQKPGGDLLIHGVITGGPAQKVGLQNDDVIVSIDGHDAHDMSTMQASSLIRGDAGTQVTLVIRRKGQTLPAIALTRVAVKIPSVEDKTLTGNIGYIHILTFMPEHNEEEVEKAVTRHQNDKALIFDLRHNGGGLVPNAVQEVSMVLEKGTVMTTKERIPGAGHLTTSVVLEPTRAYEVSSSDQAKTQTKTSVHRHPVIFNGPIVVLVDDYTASASEIFAGALKDNRRAVVIGTRTFGKGIGQRLVDMPNGTMVYVTTFRDYTPSGTWIGDGNNTRYGIEPDITVPADKDYGMNFGGPNDNQLKAAIEYLQKHH